MVARDSEIQQSVLDELRWDTRVAATEVGVEVDRGVVTLTGTVSSWARRVAAQEAAHRVWGVLDVANDIVVRPPESKTRTDAEIAHAVRHALEWDVSVPDPHIRCTVSRGWVTLEGEVDFQSEREDAERAIRNLTGVVGLTNRLELTPRAGLRHEVRQSIEGALARRVGREVRRLKLEVTDDRVHVAGVVHSQSEKDAVLGAIRGTPGVHKVTAELGIEAAPKAAT